MKVAVSLPNPLFEAVERVALWRHIPRSRVFAEALKEYLSRHGPETVTAQLDEVYRSESSQVDAPLAQAQFASIEHETW